MDSAQTIAEAAQWQAVSVPLDSTYKGFVLIIVTAICYPLLLFFVALRSYVRIWVPRSFALDDGKGYYLPPNTGTHLPLLAACLLATVGPTLLDCL